MRILAVLAAVLSLAVAPASGDQNDPRLTVLFDDLRSAPTVAEAARAEAQIWAIWTGYPFDDRVDAAMQEGLARMGQGRFAEALEAFDQAVRMAPEFAEAWNKRATVHYLMGDLQRSIADVGATLKLEPRHFGALSGLGLINLRLGDKRAALEAFEAALEIHPFLPARDRIEALRDAVGGEKL